MTHIKITSLIMCSHCKCRIYLWQCKPHESLIDLRLVSLQCPDCQVQLARTEKGSGVFELYEPNGIMAIDKV
mgnify:CR=1 FL=1